MTNILFVHQSFPGQFVHLASQLVKRPDTRVAAIGASHAADLPGVRLVKYQFAEADAPTGHAFASSFNIECGRGEQVLYACLNLMASGFVPDIVYAHPGWGESLPLRALFPDARILAYCEYYSRSDGQDCNFDPEFSNADLPSRVGLHLKNASTLLALDDCNVGVSPIRWQKETFPVAFQNKIRVIHDGVDTDLLHPDEAACFCALGPEADGRRRSRHLCDTASRTTARLPCVHARPAGDTERETERSGSHHRGGRRRLWRARAASERLADDLE